MYQQLIDLNSLLVHNGVKRLSDNAFVPFDPANTCYQAFLAWCAEGNEPLPADEGESN
jgi:hypothetical protein